VRISNGNPVEERTSARDLKTTEIGYLRKSTLLYWKDAKW